MHSISEQTKTNEEWQTLVSKRVRLIKELQGDIKKMFDEVNSLGPNGRINPAWATKKVSEACGNQAIYFNEYPLQRPFMQLTKPGSFFSQPPAGALGWGLGAALGAKLAMPDRVVVAALGDGAYFFNNPAVCHFLSVANNLPVLIIIFNNERWQAVRGSTMQMYPDGFAASMNDDVPLSSLKPSPEFEMYVKASGGLGIRVEEPESLLPALKEGIDVVQKGRQVLLNIQT